MFNLYWHTAQSFVNVSLKSEVLYKSKDVNKAIVSLSDQIYCEKEDNSFLLLANKINAYRCQNIQLFDFFSL